MSRASFVELSSCEACLRRARLIELLAPFIEKVATGAPGSRSSQLLVREDEDLARRVAPSKAERVLEEAALISEDALRARIEAAGVWALCRHDPAFPCGLLDIGDPPVLLTGRGDLALLAELKPDRCVAVVGARRATSYGRGVAQDLARGLAGDLVVVSGMAKGIDAAAHRGALSGNGLTVAVLGSGADRPYPPSEERLYEEIVKRGLVLSESLPGGEPFRWTFPARNRIMAAMAGMTVVVEAAERSGSLITSDLANQFGRDVGAVPGPVNAAMCAGTNNLLHDGAAVIRHAGDVLDAMLGPGRSHVSAGPPLNTEERALLERLESGLSTLDALAAADPASIGQTAGALTRLELLGYVRRELSGAYGRTLLDLPSLARADT